MSNSTEETDGSNGETREPRIMYRTFTNDSSDICQNATDVPFIYILCGLLITFCVGVTICDPSRNTVTYMIDKSLDFIDKPSVKKSIAISTVTTTLMIIGFLRLLQSDAKKGIFITVGKLFLEIEIFCLLFSIMTSIGAPRTFMVYFSYGLLKIIYSLSIIVSIDNAGMKNVVELISKSCRAILFFRCLILFVMCIMALVTFVVTSMLTIYDPRKMNFLQFVTIVGGIYFCLFISYFGKMVISQTTVSWHRAQDKEALSVTSIWKCISTIFRFHLGSIALGATVILPLYFILRILYKSQSDSFRQSPTNRFISIICKIKLILCVSDYALIVISMHGQDFFQATEKSFSLMTKNCSLWWGVVNMNVVLMPIPSAIIMSLSTIVYIFFCSVFSEFDHLTSDEWKTILGSTIVLLIPIWITMQTAVDTTLMYLLDNSEENDGKSCSCTTDSTLEV